VGSPAVDRSCTVRTWRWHAAWRTTTSHHEGHGQSLQSPHRSAGSYQPGRLLRTFHQHVTEKHCRLTRGLLPAKPRFRHTTVYRRSTSATIEQTQLDHKLHSTASRGHAPANLFPSRVRNFKHTRLRIRKCIGNESAPIQLAQCRFRGLAISNAKNNNMFLK